MSESAAKAKDDPLVVEKKNGNGSKKQKQVSDPSLNMDELRELANLVIEHGFTDFEFENENIRVRLSKASAFVPSSHAVPVGTAASTASTATLPTNVPAGESSLAATEPDEGLHKITSPIVGTFYRSPGPDKESYVKEGSKVTPESVVCIVEAMKLMNEIESDMSGEVLRIFAENGQPVEYGQPLFGIRPSRKK